MDRRGLTCGVARQTGWATVGHHVGQVRAILPWDEVVGGGGHLSAARELEPTGGRLPIGTGVGCQHSS